MNRWRDFSYLKRKVERKNSKLLALNHLRNKQKWSKFSSNE